MGAASAEAGAPPSREAPPRTNVHANRKPGSVPLAREAAIGLRPPLPAASNGLPGSRRRGPRRGRLATPVLLYVAFLRVGLAVPRASPSSRWALTPPFHPCPIRPLSRAAVGGLLSVALSLGLRPVGVTHHPALRSPDFPRRSLPAAALSARTTRSYRAGALARGGPTAGGPSRLRVLHLQDEVAKDLPPLVRVGDGGAEDRVGALERETVVGDRPVRPALGHGRQVDAGASADGSA